MKKRNKTVLCKDGFSMSVQASSTHYCSPRIDNATQYSSVEIGFPSHPESLITAYAEDSSSPTGTVYPYVPAHLVTLIITKHGGMDSGQVPSGVMVYDEVSQKRT